MQIITRNNKIKIVIGKKENDFIQKIEIIEELLKYNYKIYENDEEFIIYTRGRRDIAPVFVIKYEQYLKFKNRRGNQ